MNNLYPLYIDPGTGSMLFSVLIGLLATLYFVLRAAIIKLKFIFSGKKQNTVSSELGENPNNFAIYCEGKQYITVFKPILDEFEKRKISVSYLTSVELDDAFNTDYQYIKTQYIGEGNKAFFHLNMLNANICLMTTPGLQVYQLKRSKGVKHYSHVLHMVNDATTYKLFGLDYFDSILLSGDYQKKDIRLLEKMRGIKGKELITVGCPYLDELQKKVDKIPIEETTKAINHKFTVLVSPSWGKEAILSKYGEKLLAPLKATSFSIIVRPHPQTKKSEETILNNLMEQFPEQENFHWDFERDNIYSLAKADIMLSDYSGIIFDYSFLFDKPIMYVNSDYDLRPYDAGDLSELDPPIMPWQFTILHEIGRELKIEEFENIESIIKTISDDENMHIARNRAKDTAWQYIGQSNTKIVDYLVSKNAEIQKKGNTK